MFTVTWKKLSDGRTIRSEEYPSAEEAIAEAQDPPYLGLNEPVEVVVTDENGAVLFPTVSKNA